MKHTERNEEVKDVVDKINSRYEELRDLRKFLVTIDSTKNIKRGSGIWDILSFIKIKEQKSFSIFGSRWFGVGTHKQEIRIPNTMIDGLEILARERLRILEMELNGLTNNQHE